MQLPSIDHPTNRPNFSRVTPGTCWACGGPETFGPHYHEPECPSCHADLVDGIGSDADDDPLGIDPDDGRTYCVACGEIDPVAGWIVATHVERGNRERGWTVDDERSDRPTFAAPLAPDEIARRRAIVTVGQAEW